MITPVVLAELWEAARPNHSLLHGPAALLEILQLVVTLLMSACPLPRRNGGNVFLALYPNQPHHASSSSGRGSGGRFATLHDFTSSGPPRGRPQHRSDDEDDEDDDRQEGERWFAGGERSGISIENPDRPSRGTGGLGTVRDILRKAAEGGPPPEVNPASSSSSHAFRGSGNILGSDEIPSQFVPDPVAPVRGRPAGNNFDLNEEDGGEGEGEEMETAVREITFWRNGFSIQDGPLMAYDDPANQRILQGINDGHPVELRVSRRINEDYVQPPKRFAAFEGQGNRLGSPIPGGVTPGTGAAPTASRQPPGAFPTQPSGSSSTPSAEAASITTRFEVDMSAPTTSVQIRLADGTRLVSRMNLTHTVGDIRAFINASRPGQSSTPYTIGTTFPNRTLDDDSITIEAAGLQNSVIVQRRA
ncbi:hypothetical protein FRB99_004551 [Tulasnella sp. 403]|nr:hypothetical protein FRB99_004551 [Tulasnella sp. 403]